MISLADKLQGISVPASASWLVGTSSASTGVYPKSVAISGTNYVVVATSVDGLSYAHIASISLDGDLNWQRKLTHATAINNVKVACDTAGNIYVLCVDAQADTVVTLCKYTSDGTLSWQRKLSESAVDVGLNLAIATFSDTNVYVAVTHLYSTRRAVTLVKYSNAGVLAWQNRIDSVSYGLHLGAIACDASENIFVVHYSEINGKMFAAKFNNAGGRSATFKYENTTYAAAGNCCVDESGNLYIATLNPKAGTDATIIKLNNSLVYQGVLRLDGATEATSVSVRDSVLLATTNIATYFTASSALALSTQRSMTSSHGGTKISHGCLIDADGNGLVLVFAKNSSATYYDSLLFKLDLSNDLGVYGTVTVAETAFSTLSHTYTTPTDTFTDASGTLTDAAGGLTDAAASLTITLYPKA